MQGPVTTDAILDTAEERTGLTRTQLLVLVARPCAIWRRIRRTRNSSF